MNERIADDAKPLIDAFRAAGGRSFDAVGVDRARADYERSCAANGLPRIEMARVSDVVVDGVPLRVYQPHRHPEIPHTPPGAAILFLHGGGWVIGSLDTHDPLCRQLASSTGALVVAVDYRLAPEHPYPAALDDARSALRSLRSGAVIATQGIPTTVAVVGDSAGGGLAAVVAAETADASVDAGSRLVAQVLLYPVTDLSMKTESYRRISSGFPLSATTMQWFIDRYAPSPIDRSQPSLSPLRRTQPVMPIDAFVCTVGLDPLSDEGIEYAATLAQAGGHVQHLHLPHHTHGLFTAAGVIPTGRRVLDDVARFLRDRLDHNTREPFRAS